MVYQNMGEEDVEAKKRELAAKATGAATLSNQGKEDGELRERLIELWNNVIAEERLPAAQLAAYTTFMMELGASISVALGKGAPNEYAHGLTIGFQIAHDYVVKYGKLLED